MTIRTLVVDDDFAVARMHRRFVEALDGFEVVAVLERGAPVADFLAGHEVDLVLLDVHLPDRNGVEVLQDLRATGHDVAVVMVTAASERDTVRRAVGLGVDGYLVKPFSREDFNARLLEIAALVQGADAADPDHQELEQAEIDQLVRGASGRAPEVAPAGAPGPAEQGLPGRLPKGFSAPTLQLVAESLQRAGAGADVSAREVAADCGISRVSARRYLEFLTSQDLAELRPRYGAAGRPEHRYLWTGR